MAYNFLGNDHSNEFGTQDIADNKVICILAYIPILFWLPLVTGNTPYCKFHANQGLILLITSLVLGVATSIIGLIIGWIPILGTIITGIISLVTSLAMLLLMIYGMVCTGQGQAKELIGVGGLVKIINW